MRLRPTLKKTVVSLIVGAVCALTLLILSFFGFDFSLAIIIAVFVVVSALVYAVWSLIQPEFEPWE